MGTLSKSFGSCGGYIAGCKARCRVSEIHRAGICLQRRHLAAQCRRIPGFHPAAGSRTAARDAPARRAKLFLSLAKKHRLNTGLSKDSPVVPIILGNSMHCLQLSQALCARGINVQPILYPAVEEKAARLRFFISSNHSDDQIRYTVAAVAEELVKIDPAYASWPLATPAEKLEPSPR